VIPGFPGVLSREDVVPLVVVCLERVTPGAGPFLEGHIGVAALEIGPELLPGVVNGARIVPPAVVHVQGGFKFQGLVYVVSQFEEPAVVRVVRVAPVTLRAVQGAGDVVPELPDDVFVFEGGDECAVGASPDVQPEPEILGIPRYDVDDATEAVRAVEDGFAALGDFDAVHMVERQHVVGEAAEDRHVHGAAVYEEFRALSADADLGAGIGFGGAVS